VSLPIVEIGDREAEPGVLDERCDRGWWSIMYAAVCSHTSVSATTRLMWLLSTSRTSRLVQNDTSPVEPAFRFFSRTGSSGASPELASGLIASTMGDTRSESNARQDIPSAGRVPFAPAWRRNAPRIKGVGDVAQRRRARLPDFVDDRQNVACGAIGFRLQYRGGPAPRLVELGLPSLTPRAFAAASADLVRPAISARSFSASAAYKCSGRKYALPPISDIDLATKWASLDPLVVRQSCDDHQPNRVIFLVEIRLFCTRGRDTYRSPFPS